MRTRYVVVGVIENEKGQILLGKMYKDKGVYPGQWAIPGGGIEENETLDQALKREIKEETGLEVISYTPSYFNAYEVTKRYGDGKKEDLYMVCFHFLCKARGEVHHSNDEFEEIRWFDKDGLRNLDLNEASVWLFNKLGYL